MEVQGYNKMNIHPGKKSLRTYHPYSIDYCDTAMKSHTGKSLPHMTSSYYNKGGNYLQHNNSHSHQETICKLDVNTVAASARERDRTNNVNSAFVTLRTLIPTDPIDRKLSKIETLRLASSYISHLQTVLSVGLDPTQQPCMKRERYVRQLMGKHEETPSPICTFCLSGSKGNRGGVGTGHNHGTSGCPERIEVTTSVATTVGDNRGYQAGTRAISAGPFQRTEQYMCSSY